MVQRTGVVKITKKLIDMLEPRDREYSLWDEEIPGFGMRVWPSGLKVFTLKYRFHGRQRWATLGRFGEITVDEARLKAYRFRGVVAEGQDPMAILHARKTAPTMQKLADQFIEEYVATHVRASTARMYKSLTEKFIVPALGDILVQDVDRAAISKLHHSMARTPRQANLMIRVLSKILSLAEEWGFRPLQSNPCFRFRGFKENKRERFLNPKEIARLGKVLEQLERDNEESPFVIAAIRLLLFTGARHQEILNLKWAWVDLDRGVIRLPEAASKTGAKNILLNDLALEVLRHLPRSKGNPHVITGSLEGKQLGNLKDPWEIIRTKAKLPDLRVHDLRHTFASVGVLNGLNLPAVGGLLGHTQSSTTQRYAHLSQGALHDANNTIGKALETALQSTDDEEK